MVPQNRKKEKLSTMKSAANCFPRDMTAINPFKIRAKTNSFQFRFFPLKCKTDYHTAQASDN